MRLADTLVIPPELEAVRVAGDLVIFAGAGISMSSPAGLPGFRELACEIAEPVVPWAETYANAIDRYLDRAEQAGIRVHERARQILNSRGGQHTALHEHLIGLFGTADRVRLITTNFDPFFTTASQAVFPSAAISHYTGPALPLGREFAGVAQLHGSLSNHHEGLVLTGRDFGAAYLTDAWATRFLLGVFSRRIVVFTGYRLGDPVIQYLLMALPVRGRAYALCHHSERDPWREFGIEPISFDTSPNGDRFADLNDGVQQWRWYAQASAATHDTELRRIVALGTVLMPKDEDYVRTRLMTAEGRATFCNAAVSVEWFDWAAKEKLLDSLLDESALPDSTVQWADWCLTRFLSGPSPALLRFIRERSLTLNPTLTTMLALHLWRELPTLNRSVIRQYLALIVNQERWAPVGDDYHVWLLQKLVEHGMFDEALALLRYLTQVRLKKVEHYFLSEQDSGEELPALALGIEIAGSADLAQYIDEHGAELAAHLASQMLAIGEQRIRESYALISLASGELHDRFDWLSFRRTAIAESNQDTGGDAEDVLVVIAREAIDELLAIDPDTVLAFAVARSASAEALLLRRLALYAFSKHKSLDRDWLLDRLREERWPHEVWLRPELYRVLTAHYPAATETARARLIADLERNDWWPPEDEFVSRRRFDLSQLLGRIAPKSGATATFAERERISHPDWGETDPDGFLSRTDVRWGNEEASPVDLSTMLSWSPQEARAKIHRILSESANHRHGLEHSLLGTLQSAAKTDPVWATSLFATISERDEQIVIDARIAEAIGWGFREADLTAQQQIDFLRKVATFRWPEDAANAISFAIHAWTEKIPQNSAPELLDTFDAAADAIFERSRSAVPVLVERGWFERAINHPAGRAAEVWWNVANSRNRLSGEFVLRIDDRERERWQRVLSDETAAGAYARPILGMAAERLLAGDRAWSERTLIPVFAPSCGDSAVQLWDGRLHYPRWSWSFVTAVDRFWDTFLSSSDKLVPAQSERLGDVVALLIAQHANSNFTRRRLTLFIQHTTDEGRRSFASAIPRHLETITNQERAKLWRDLLGPYWRDRLTNMPRGLSADEVQEMVWWIPALPEVSMEAASLLLQTDCPPLPHAGGILHEWHEDARFVRDHPNAATAVVEFLGAGRSVRPWEIPDAIHALDVAFDAGADAKALIRAADALATGTMSGEANALAARLRAKG